MIGSRYLRIDLSTGKTNAEPIDARVRMDFIGGRGLGISYLYKELAPRTDPLEPQNKLIIATGVLAGTSAQAVSRWMACTRSPLTGAFARSVCGADFGAWLRFTGYDFLIIEGKAEKPVYVHLTPDGCRLLDAVEIWGKDTSATQEWLAGRHGTDTRTACIGPAGEKLVRFAAIVSGRRTAARCGTGTVMGSKNLKAIAITARRRLDLADPAAFSVLVKEQIAAMQANKSFQHHKEMGTTDTADVTNKIGIFPVRNFRYGRQADCEKILSPEYLKLRAGEFGCYSCAARCGKAHRVPPGRPYAGAYSEGPEYESIWSFTGPIESNSVEATIVADQLCDDYGLDTISTGNVIGFAFELFEKGILTMADTDGLELAYDNHAAMLSLVKKIAHREGIGHILAEGTRRAAGAIGKGAAACAMQVKGLELPAYEPRGAKSQGFNYVTSNIGGSHCYGYARQEVFGAPVPRAVDRFAEEENADIVIYNQNEGATREVGIACAFSTRWGWYPEVFGKMLAAASGIKEFADVSYLHCVGERIVNLERAFNVREGFSRKDDTLPARMLTEPLLTRGAPGEGQVVTNQDRFLDRYYRLRGWTKQGVPMAAKLRELGLEWPSAGFPTESGWGNRSWKLKADC